MKLLNKCKIEILNGKIEKKLVLIKAISVVDSVADQLLIDSEQAQKRQVNLTGVEEITSSGDKLNKSASIYVWEEVKKKSAPETQKSDDTKDKK